MERKGGGEVIWDERVGRGGGFLKVRVTVFFKGMNLIGIGCIGNKRSRFEIGGEPVGRPGNFQNISIILSLIVLKSRFKSLKGILRVPNRRWRRER